jgi:hypothetical protein
METLYTAYTKLIDNKLMFFVKRYTHFPELADAPDVLESFGMHKDFDRACDIAKVEEASIRTRLWNELQGLPAAKVIEMNTPPNEEKTHQGWLGHFKLFGFLKIAR